jgi:glucose/arabinose dehydrogenase
MLRACLVVSVVVLALGACGSGDSTEPAGGSPPAAEPQREQRESGAAGREGGTSAGAAAQARGVRLAAVGRFDAPLYVTSPPGDERRVFVVEQGGRIRVVRGGRKLRAPFLDITAQVLSGSEQGLLSMAFAPDYAQSRRFYVYFTGRDGRQNVVEYRAASADRADAGSARLVLRMDDPEANHNGGLLLFGPDDLLYIGTGDGGGGNDQHGRRGNGQSLGTLLGKILRIDPRASGGRPYRTPSSNPFAGRSGARAEIYSYGLRNPWRFSFDRRTGDLSIGDVGQNAVEEVSFVRRGRGRGANFGWRPFEGRTRIFDEPAPNAIAPVITHGHDEGWCSVTGGHIVRDPSVPALAGRYVYGDFCEGRIRSTRLRAGRRTTGRALDLPTVANLSSFGEDARGRVYVTSLAGPVYRLASR